MGKKIPVQAIKLTASDLSPAPERFFENGQPMEMCRYYVWFMYHEANDKPPILGIRVMNPEGFTTQLGLVRFGETLTEKQTYFDFTEKTKGKVAAKYTKVAENPDVWETRASDPEVSVKYSESWASLIDGEWVDLKWEHFQYTIMNDKEVWGDSCRFNQHCFVSGKLNGKAIEALGCWDKFYGKHSFYGYEGLVGGMPYIGIREDGRKEYGELSIKAGKPNMTYIIDGEEPLITTDVKCDFEWELLPYAPDGDTYVLKKATVHFADKVMHYEGKWGCSGNTKENDSFPGFSQSSGYWYIGETPYKHKKFFSWWEFWNAHKKEIADFTG